MALPESEFERVHFFESARDKAAECYLSNPEDSDNLTRWGGALLELAQYQHGQASLDMVKDAVSKLEEARKINPLKHETLWCLGNAHTTEGFLLTEGEEANDCFQKASQRFQEALEVEPNNDLYRKAVEMSERAPELHKELQAQLNAQQGNFGAQSGSSGGGGSASKSQKKKGKNSDFKYDLLGWVVLAVGVVVWIGFAKAPSPPPSES